VSASGKSTQTLLLPNQGSVPSAPPSGYALLYAANGEPLILAPGATQGTPLFRGFKNWLRNGAAQVWSGGQGTRTAPVSPLRLMDSGYATYHCDGWCVLPETAPVTTNAAGSIGASGLYSTGSVQVNGGGGCTGYRIGQRLPAHTGGVMATVAKYFTFSGFIFNGSGTTFSPQVHINVANSANNFSGVTNRFNTGLAALAHGQATRFSVTFAPNSMAAMGQGVEFVAYVPNGSAHTGYCTFGGFQVNEGGHALELEILPREIEVARSLAWLSTSYSHGQPPGSSSNGGLHQVVSDQNNTNQIGGVSWPPMALTPDVAIYAANGALGRVSDVSYGTTANPTSVVAADIGTAGFRCLVATGGGYTSHQAYTYHHQASCELI
jgi:hypothetical protein